MQDGTNPVRVLKSCTKREKVRGLPVHRKEFKCMARVRNKSLLEKE